MNIQIFGTKKCNDTRKAERFFKERGIKYQFIDMKEKGMSKGEFNSVAQANGGLDNMVNWDGKDKDLLALIKYIADEDKLEKVLENPQVIKTPVVRNGKQSTLGYLPDVWKKLELEDSICKKMRKSVDKTIMVIYNTLCCDGVWLSLARAPGLGPGGRRFESCHPDLYKRIDI